MRMMLCLKGTLASFALLLTSCSGAAVQPRPTPKSHALPQTDPRRPLPWSPADVFRVVLDNIDRADYLAVDDVNRIVSDRLDKRREPRVTTIGVDESYDCAVNSLGVPQPYLTRLCAGRSDVHRLLVIGRNNGGPSRDDAGAEMNPAEFTPYNLFKSDVLVRASAKSIPVIDITHDRLFEQQHNRGHMPSLLEAVMLVSAGGRRITIILLNPDGSYGIVGQTVRSIDTYTVD